MVNGKFDKKPEDIHYEIKDRKFLMLASIGDQAIGAAPTIIVTTLIGLAASSVFSIYSMIFVSVKTLINSFHHAVSAIFGNLVASSGEDNNKIREVFDTLLYIFMMLGALLASCCAFLFMGFIKLYSSGFTEGVYIQPILACFIVAYIAIFSVRTVFNFVSHSYGLFKLTCKVTVIFGAIGVCISAIATKLWGLPYVMLGVVFYHFITTCVLVYSFKKKIVWFKIEKKWIMRIAIMILLPVISWNIYSSGVFLTESWIGWFLMAVQYAIAVAACLLVYTLIFDRKPFLSLISYGKAIFGVKKTK